MYKKILLFFLIIPNFVLAADIKYYGTEMISTDTIESNKEYESLMGGKSVLVILIS